MKRVLAVLFFLLVTKSLLFSQEMDLVESIQLNLNSLNETINLEGYQYAILQLNEDLGKLEKSSDSNNIIKNELYHKIAVCKYYNGDLLDALKSIKEAKRLRFNSKPIDTINLARSCQVEGAINRFIGNYKDSGKSYLDATRLYEGILSENPNDTPNIKRLFYTYEDYGKTLEKIGEFNLAKIVVKRMESSLNRLEKEPSMLGRFYGYKGTIYWKLGNIDSAIICQKYALKHFQQLELSQAFENISSVKSNLGLIYLEQKKYNLAIRFFEEANYLFEYMPDRLNVFNWTYLNNNLNLLNSYIKAGYAQDVKNTFRKTCDITNSISISYFHPYIGELYQLISLWQLQQENYNNALDSLQKSYTALIKKPQYHSNYKLPIISNTYINDTKYLLQSLQIKQTIHQERYQEKGDLYDLKAIKATALTIDTLIHQIRNNQELIESKVRILNEEYDTYEQGIRACLDLYDQTENTDDLDAAFGLVAGTKSVIFLQDLNREELKKSFKLDKNLSSRQNENQLATRVVEYQLSTVDEDEELETRLRDSLLYLRQNSRLIQEEIAEKYPNYAELSEQSIKRIKTNDLASGLPKNMLLLDYFVGAQELFVFAVSRKKTKYYRFPLSIDLVDFCDQLHGRHINPQTEVFPDIKATSESLYQLLLEPILKDFGDYGISRLKIIPDGPLWKLSFEALQIPQEEKKVKYLLEDYAISYAYSSHLVADQKSKRKAKKYLKNYIGFGLDYKNFSEDDISRLNELMLRYRGVGSLPLADDEITSVASLLDGKYWINEEASKDVFLEEASKADIIHLSMHGLLNNRNPMSSSLVFNKKDDYSDYLLRADELLSQSLDAEMAVLSACHTGDGPFVTGEGVESLARAFAYGGSASVVASLWGASDKSTHDITIAFYQALKEGYPKDVALQKAKLKYLEGASPYQSNPAFWSHMVVIGDTRQFAGTGGILKIIAFGVLGLAISLFLFAKSRKRKQRA